MYAMDNLNLILLSHHHSRDQYRCLRIVWRGKPVLLCARCSGMVLGMFAGVILQVLSLAGPPSYLHWLALVDWILGVAGLWRGCNTVRVASGILLGLYYVRNMAALVCWNWSASLLITDLGFVAIYGAGVLWLLHIRHNTYGASPRP